MRKPYNHLLTVAVMYHEPPQNFLYSAYLIETEFAGRDGSTVSGVGTGFVLNAGLWAPLIVTSRHVVDRCYRDSIGKYAGFELTRLMLTGRSAEDSLYQFEIHSAAKIFYHDNHENDVVLIEGRIKSDGPDSVHWHFGLEHLADESAFCNIDPFDLICYTGFPDQHDRRSVRPVLRSGRIASDPRFTYSWDRADHGDCVAYEGFSSGGASGAPIFAPPRGASGIPNSRHGYLIGVNAGHVPSQHGHSGISYFYKSTVVVDIVGAINAAVTAPRGDG